MNDISKVVLDAAFAPLAEAETASAIAARPAAETWEPQLPAPNEPPEAIRHPKHGVASRAWVYRDESGQPLFAVARFDFTGSGGEAAKELLPYSFGRRVWTTRTGEQRDVTGWHFKRPRGPLPLYGLDRLTARPHAELMIVEGEQAADAATQLFPDWVAIASAGGAKAADKSDWSPLAGRHVAIWPDNDQPGAAYAAAVSEQLVKVGAASIRLVAIPADWPDGWDVADALPPGATLDQLRQMLAGASPVQAAPEGQSAAQVDEVLPELPSSFFFNERGLHYQPSPRDRNRDPAPIWIAAPFSVVAETSNAADEEPALLLRWAGSKEWLMPRELLHAEGSGIARELERRGLRCGSRKAAHDGLKDFLTQIECKRRLLCVSRAGWQQTPAGPIYLLPEGFGPLAGEVILQNRSAGAAEGVRSAGSLGDWQEHVAQFAVGNDRLALFISLALAAPLFELTGEPSGLVHLVGNSRDGKTTLLGCAASVWGRATTGAAIRTWRTTDNGLEGVAEQTCDGFLALDELDQCDARHVGAITYQLANEAGKSRASRDGSARAAKTWRLLGGSTGEVSIAEKLREAGQRSRAGHEVRVISVPADAGSGMGVWQSLHGFADPRALAEHLRAATRTYYGSAARAFLDRLAQERAGDPDRLRARIDHLRDQFKARWVLAVRTDRCCRSAHGLRCCTQPPSWRLIGASCLGPSAKRCARSARASRRGSMNAAEPAPRKRIRPWRR